MINFLARGSAETRALVKLTLDSGVKRFMSGDHPIIDDPPIIEAISDVGQDLDLLSRVVSYNSTDVTFVDDDIIRDLIFTEAFFGKKIEILLGTTEVAEGTFEKIYEGVLTDPKPSAGQIVVPSDDLRSITRNALITARDFSASDLHYLINRNPLQYMQSILLAILDVSQINLSSFDPDNFDTGTNAISHWNTARAIHGNFDRRITEPTSAWELLRELTSLVNGTLRVRIDGVVEYKHFEPTDASVATLDDQDFRRPFKQTGTFTNLRNLWTFQFGWKGRALSEDPVLAAVPSGRGRTALNGDFFHFWQTSDQDSAVDHKHPDISINRLEGEGSSTKWVGVNTLLEAETSAAATSITVIGGWLGSFCGVDRILNGVSDGKVNSDLNATNRPGFIMLELPIAAPDQVVIAREIIKIDGATIDFTNTGHPTNDGNSDLVGIPMRVTFTVAAGGRAQFGTTALTFPKNSLVTDFTIPIGFTERRIKRLTNGLPIAEAEVGLEFIDIEVADFISLVEPFVFLARGEDGLTGVEKLEVIGKAIRPIGDDAGVILTATPVEDPSLTNVDDIFGRPRDFLDDLFGTFDNDDAPFTDTYVPAGLEIINAGGLDATIKRGRVCGPFGSIEITVDSASTPITLKAIRDNYLFLDSHTRLFVLKDVAVSGATPLASRGQAIIGKVETNATTFVPGTLSVPNPEDLRLGLRDPATPESLFGANGTAINGALSKRFRNPDRYPPDGLEVFPMDTVWGPSGAAGNDAELDQTVSSLSSGDATVKLLTPDKGVRGPLYTVDGELDYQAEFKWSGPIVGGDAAAAIEFYTEDKRTQVAGSLWHGYSGCRSEFSALAYANSHDG